MHSSFRFTACLILFASSLLFGASSPRSWQSGLLVGTEKEQIQRGATTTSDRERNTRLRNGNIESSESRRSRTTDDYDSFQVYTIQAQDKTYVVSERLFFPWSKPVNVTVGSQLKFAVERNTVYLVGGDGKEHKASVKKVRMAQTQ